MKEINNFIIHVSWKTIWIKRKSQIVIEMINKSTFIYLKYVNIQNWKANVTTMTAVECLLDRGGESKTKNCLICSTTPVFLYSTMHEGGQCFPFMFVQHIIKTIEQSSHPQRLLQRLGPESMRKKTCKTNQELCFTEDWCFITGSYNI